MISSNESMIFLQFSIPVKAGFPSMYETDDNEQIAAEKTKKEIELERLLGPEDNFPFLPDNHRDSSNPIGRIGKITDLP